MPKGRPQASWLRQVKSYLKDMDMTGLASAWAKARRKTKEYRHKVDAATRCSGVCPDLTSTSTLHYITSTFTRQSPHCQLSVYPQLGSFCFHL